MGKLGDYETQSGAEEGIEVPLETPEGKKTEDWIKVRGFDSDTFQKHRIQCERKTVLETMDPAQDTPELELARKRRLIAGLVMAWSFEDECTPEAVEAWFAKAPQIMTVVETLATSRNLFFQLRSSRSSNMSEKAQNSTDDPADQN